MDYQHTQRGHLLPMVSVGLVVLLGSILALEADAVVAIAITVVTGAFILGVVWIFNRLTVTVNDGVLTAAFGPGWPKALISSSTAECYAGSRPWTHSC